jgi:hypothetical protein
MIVFGIRYCDFCNEAISHGERFLSMRKLDKPPVNGPIECLHFHEQEGKRCFTGYLEKRLDAHEIVTKEATLEAGRHS